MWSKLRMCMKVAKIGKKQHRTAENCPVMYDIGVGESVYGDKFTTGNK